MFNIFRDDYDNVYFNEFLFACMRRIFGSQIENASSDAMYLLGKEEHSTRKRIELMKSQTQKKVFLNKNKIMDDELLDKVKHDEPL